MGYKIFILDDDENACKLAERVLTEAGYQVMSRTQAIGTTVSISAFQPDLVLLDLMMPALTGEAVIGILDQHMKPRPKIVLFSNKSTPELRAIAEKNKVEGYVCKVDGPSALLKAVRAALGQA
jgi:DNA-binding response OmpR family regulator